MSDQTLQSETEKLKKRNQRLSIALVLLIGVLLVGSSTLGIDGILFSPNSNSAKQTVVRNLHDSQTIDAILTKNAITHPGYWLPEAKQTATALSPDYDQRSTSQPQ